MFKIAAIVILYNPNDDVYGNILSYVNQVDKVFVIDNSERQNRLVIDKIEELSNTQYHWCQSNLGIAAALNKGMAFAIEELYDFVLTMDQDSSVSENLIQEFVVFLQKDISSGVGILYARHIYKNYSIPANDELYQEILVADTSGSLIRIDAYKKAGLFLEKLFIDYVDFEYCLRLRSMGFKIVQINTVKLWQQLGSMVLKKILIWDIGVSNHSFIRIYYRVRNRLYVSALYLFKYPIWSIKQTLYFPVEIGKVLFFEKDRKRKMKSIFLGVIDFVRISLKELINKD